GFHVTGVQTCALPICPRGNLIAAASDDGNVYLWDSTTGQRVATLRGHTSYVTDVAFSGDGTMLASSSEDDTVRVWKVPAGGSLEIGRASGRGRGQGAA